MEKEEKTHVVSCGRPVGEVAHLAVEINGAQFAPLAVVQVLWLYLVLTPGTCTCLLPPRAQTWMSRWSEKRRA